MFIRFGVCATASVLAALGAGYAAGDRPAEPKEKIGIRGTIERITPAGAEQARRGSLGEVFVVGRKEPDTEVDQAVALVTCTTRLLRLEKGKRVPVRFNDLKKGQQVEVRFQPGPRIMIYPLRAAAAEILVLSTPEAKKP